MFIVSPFYYRKLARTLTYALPELHVNTPYGNFIIRNQSSDIVMVRPAYERHIFQTLCKKANTVFVDVGANIGRHSIAVAKQKTKCKILAIEPLEETYKALTNNINRNKGINVVPLKYACVSKKRPVRIYTAGKRFHGYSTLKKSQLSAYHFTYDGSEVVEGIDLDNIISKQGISYKDVDVVKIDVEGAEDEVLSGAHKLLSQGHAAIVFEAWTKKNFQKCANILNKYGYRISPLDYENFLAEK